MCFKPNKFITLFTLYRLLLLFITFVNSGVARASKIVSCMTWKLDMMKTESLWAERIEHSLGVGQFIGCSFHFQCIVFRWWFRRSFLR